MVNLGFLLIKHRREGRSVAPQDELHHLPGQDPDGWLGSNLAAITAPASPKYFGNVLTRDGFLQRGGRLKLLRITAGAGLAEPVVVGYEEPESQVSHISDEGAARIGRLPG